LDWKAARNGRTGTMIGSKTSWNHCATKAGNHLQAQAMAQGEAPAIRVDEYQGCSGEASVAAKRALTKGENAAGAKARLYFMAFTARLKSCPDTKRQRIHTFAWMPEIA